MNNLYGMLIGIFLLGTASFVWYNQVRTYDFSLGGGTQENLDEFDGNMDATFNPLKQVASDLEGIDFSQFSTTTATSSQETEDIYLEIGGATSTQ